MLYISRLISVLAPVYAGERPEELATVAGYVVEEVTLAQRAAKLGDKVLARIYIKGAKGWLEESRRYYRAKAEEKAISEGLYRASREWR